MKAKNHGGFECEKQAQCGEEFVLQAAYLLSAGS
jgi:hypothetical protein